MSEKSKLNVLNINYTNLTPLTLFSQIIKHQNTRYIDDYCNKNNISDEIKLQLIDNFIKPNYYYPSVVQKKDRERQQVLSIPNKNK